jgi:hypothetical protein
MTRPDLVEGLPRRWRDDSGLHIPELLADSPVLDDQASPQPEALGVVGVDPAADRCSANEPDPGDDLIVLREEFLQLDPDVSAERPVERSPRFGLDRVSGSTSIASRSSTSWEWGCCDIRGH